MRSAVFELPIRRRTRRRVARKMRGCRVRVSFEPETVSDRAEAAAAAIADGGDSIIDVFIVVVVGEVVHSLGW